MEDWKCKDGGVKILSLGRVEQGDSDLGGRMIALFVLPSKPGLKERLGRARNGR